MDNKQEVIDFIEQIDAKNELGYFIKINAKKTIGNFFSSDEETQTFFLESLNEIPSKYIHYKVMGINVVKPTDKENNFFKNAYVNLKKNIPAILVINIECEDK